MKNPLTMTAVWACTCVVGLGAAALIVFGAQARTDEVPAPAPALTVRMTVPQEQEVARRFAANGTIAAWQEASVGSEGNGLRLTQVLVNVGDAVRRGQVLATFERETVQAELAQLQAGVAEARAQLAEAAANAERARGLASSGALSSQQVQQYLTAEETAQARLEARRASAHAQQLRLSRTQVLAPDDGLISARTATAGAVVPAGQELFRLIRAGRLEWRAEVTPEEAARLAPGSEVTIHAADGQPVRARVRQLAPTVDPRTRTAVVYVDLPKVPGLRAGMFARGEFDQGRGNAITVPQQAVVVRDGFSYVFRLQDDGRVSQVRVRTGRQLEDRVEVVEGLTAQAQIVAAGAGFLSDGDFVKVVGR